ncbi:hypothetical protein [Rhodococcus sp. H29-C3]|uniref:TetR/AcrR family transcriptional regulator n=1 Tax=Rhodococcus sp. H29-C3 TaxID=3046307 RepID=UPI0024BB79DC|nr:hypothetical protein [Rhodococcus sp. H29-C3]MDJ0362862.1 hypothetical protein [Rhodococcus sp. H29-C3]
MDRRTVIADAAISLIAHSGMRALTHRGIDSALEFPPGSTSYYLRTKQDLIGAVVERITESSRAAFEQVNSGDPVEVTVTYLADLLTERADQLRARHALTIDPTVEPAAREQLARCLFSAEGATELLGEVRLGEGFLALCEGLIAVALMCGYDGALGYDTESLRTPVARYLNGPGA